MFLQLYLNISNNIVGEIMNNIVRNPKQKRSIQNKALLYNVAKKLFTSKGYFATSSNEIAKDAGVSIGTFYAYYNDKKTIFMEIIDEYSNEYNKKLEKALNSIQIDDYRNYIKAIILSTIDMSRMYYGFEDELMSMKYTDTDINLYSQHRKKYIISKIKKMLIRINIKNQDMDITAFLFFCLVENFSYNILHQNVLDVNVASEQCIEMILRYINMDCENINKDTN